MCFCCYVVPCLNHTVDSIRSVAHPDDERSDGTMMGDIEDLEPSEDREISEGEGATEEIHSDLKSHTTHLGDSNNNMCDDLSSQEHAISANLFGEPVDSVDVGRPGEVHEALRDGPQQELDRKTSASKAPPELNTSKINTLASHPSLRFLPAFLRKKILLRLHLQ